jgi:hypothetical protein
MSPAVYTRRVILMTDDVYTFSSSFLFGVFIKHANPREALTQIRRTPPLSTTAETWQQSHFCSKHRTLLLPSSPSCLLLEAHPISSSVQAWILRALVNGAYRSLTTVVWSHNDQLHSLRWTYMLISYKHKYLCLFSCQKTWVCNLVCQISQDSGFSAVNLMELSSIKRIKITFLEF